MSITSSTLSADEMETPAETVVASKSSDGRLRAFNKPAYAAAVVASRTSGKRDQPNAEEPRGHRRENGTSRTPTAAQYRQRQEGYRSAMVQRPFSSISSA